MLPCECESKENHVSVSWKYNHIGKTVLLLIDKDKLFAYFDSKIDDNFSKCV